MGVIETALILTMAALHLAVVTGRVRSDQLMPNTEFGSASFKERDEFALWLGEAIGDFEAVVRLDTFNGGAMIF